VSLNLIQAKTRFPVIIQHLPSSDVTFPTDRCIQCRGDQLHTCLSAKIECNEDGIPSEMIWSGSSRCQGAPNRVSGSFSSSFITCPGPEHFSPMNIDLDRFGPKLHKDFEALFPNNETIKEAILEYRRMLILNQQYPELSVVPSPLVDKVWHAHILDTAAYHRDCLKMFGKYMHHAPSFGGLDEKQKLLEQHKDMLETYVKHFGESPSSNIWPFVKSLNNYAKEDDDDDDKHSMPDCCAGYCVKVECSYKTTKSGDCVGCDPIDCGYNDVQWTDKPEGSPMIKARVKQPLSPAQFAGYVPIHEPDHPFTFSVTPFYKDGVKMVFQWNISQGVSHMRLSLTGKKTWYGLGFGSGDDRMNDGGMGFADYIVTMYNRNYTGVFDMWKYNKGNDYPCWDVLYECSPGNKTKGTKDVTDIVVQRSGSTTWSSWTRPLSTGDNKDYKITAKTMHVMFAYGKDDWFTEHKKKTTCKINMYTGSGKCGDDAWGLKAMRARLGCPSGDCPPR